MTTKSCCDISMTNAIWIASFMFIISGALTLARSMGHIESQLSIRIIGVIFGLILVISANYFPKRLFPHPESKAQRRIAWLFVIAGFLYIIVWITGDTQHTNPMFALMFAPACILSMLLYRYSKLHISTTTPSEIQSS